MGKFAGEGRSIFSGFVRWLVSRHNCTEGRLEEAPQILAIVSPGPSRLLLQAISQDCGWALTLSDTPPGIRQGYLSNVPPIVIYDRDISQYNWREIFGILTKHSPRPYMILLSPTADQNLWDELQRVGGCDILRAPVDRENLLWAVKRAWLLWHNEQKVRSPSSPWF